jgi:hypothetical protein
MSLAVWVVKAGRGKRGDGPTHDRLGKLTDDVAPFVRGDIKRGLETFRDDVSPTALERAIKGRKLDPIVQAVPWKTLPDRLDKAFDRVLKAGRQGAAGAAKELQGAIGGEGTSGAVQMVLDRTGPRLTSFFVSRKGQITQASEDGTHEAVRRELYLGRQGRMTPSQLAENVRSVIGLNARQAVAISNFRAGLGMDVRDPETGKLIRAAVPPSRRAAMVQDQIDRMLDVRADNIARTELRFATNEAQNVAWRSADAEGLLPTGSGRKWLVDGRPCAALCIPMHNVVVGLDEPWRLPDGRDVDNPTEAHPNCECVAVLVMG